MSKGWPKSIFVSLYLLKRLLGKIIFLCSVKGKNKLSDFPIDIKKILIAPLDWGLGHATRCIPIVEVFLEKNVEVVLGSNGRSLDLLKATFPNLRCIEIPGYDFEYPSGNGMVWAALKQVPKVIRRIGVEKKFVRELQLKEKFDLIISDNRYGVFCFTAQNIFVCHQMALMVPSQLKFGRKWLYNFHLSFMKPFQQIWIPDNEGRLNLSGGLTHDYTLPQKAKFVGVLSRFANLKPTERLIPYEYILVLLSGPEPQRSIFQKIIEAQAEKTDKKFVIIEGKPELNQKKAVGNFINISHLYGQDLYNYMFYAKGILCRSGYSTVMDLNAIGKKAFFVPTPGQTEQEYLAVELDRKGVAKFATQASLDLNEAINYFEEVESLNSVTTEDKLREAINLLFKV